MERYTRVLLLAAVSVLTLALTAVPALAAAGGGGGSEGPTKITFPSGPHDRIGLVIIAVVAGAVALALYNAVEHLRRR